MEADFRNPQFCNIFYILLPLSSSNFDNLNSSTMVYVLVYFILSQITSTFLHKLANGWIVLFNIVCWFLNVSEFFGGYF